MRTSHGVTTPPLHLLRPVLRADPVISGIGKGLRRSDREHLAAIATPLRVAADTVLYHRGAAAEALYNITSGTARVVHTTATSRRVLAFLFSGDLCGLAKNGAYVNSVETVTAVTAFRIPLEPLAAMLKRDADLQFSFLCKAVHAVREMQRQAVATAHRDPVDRVAAFLSMMEDAQSDEQAPGAIELPMRTRDIAEYVGIRPEEVRRAIDVLSREGAIEKVDNKSLRVVNRRRFSRRAAGG